MSCLRRGPARPSVIAGKPVNLFGCDLFQICSDEDIGLKLSSGTKAGVCHGCQKFVPREPVVSAICLTYDLPNRLDALNEAVESFLRQTWPKKELIIVNDTPGTIIEFDHPEVRIINLPERCETLGQKRNIGCEASTGDVLCSWDDDDINLPWRMSRGVQLLGVADYYNPKAYWCIYEGTLRHEVKTGIGHMASMLRRSAWEAVGKYDAVNGFEDVNIERALMSQVETVIGNGDILDSGYIYRLGDGLLHISTHSTDMDKTYTENADKGSPGTYQLKPAWKQDYLALTRALSTPPGPKLTIGMAYHRDWPGLWATIQAIRLDNPDCLNDIEIVVVDNDLDGRPEEISERNHSYKAARLCKRIGAHYEHYTAVAGTAAAKGRIFDIATAPAVLVIDCHVILPAGELRRLIDWCVANPTSRDLWQGPCIGDGGLNDVVGSSFAPRWGSQMYGQWHNDNDKLQSDEPFEIEMQGCGLFCCNKSAWPGFHPLLRGFGPEEYHIHQRIRRNGGRCWCLPWLRWCHRFGNPDGHSVPGLQTAERLRGHLITWLDTGKPDVNEIQRHFIEDIHMSQPDFDKVVGQTYSEFQDYTADPTRYEAKQKQPVAVAIPPALQQVFREPVGTNLAIVLKECGINKAWCAPCQDWLAKMDQWGLKGCQEHRADIIDRLAEAAKDASWGDWLSVARHGYLSYDALLDEAIKRTPAWHDK